MSHRNIKLLLFGFLIFFLLMNSINCNLFEDDESTIESFYGTATFTYDRPWNNRPDLWWIDSVGLNITLKAPLKDIEPPIHMEKIGKDLFQATLTESFSYKLNGEPIKHEAMVSDPCVADGTPFSSQTGHGITVTIPGFIIESEIIPQSVGGTRLLWWMVPE